MVPAITRYTTDRTLSHGTCNYVINNVDGRLAMQARGTANWMVGRSQATQPVPTYVAPKQTYEDGMLPWYAVMGCQLLRASGVAVGDHVKNWNFYIVIQFYFKMYMLGVWVF